MKRFNKLFITLLLLVTVTISCQDEDLLEINNPTWETAVHGFAQFAEGSAQNFVFQDASVDISLTYQWVSIEGANEVTKVDFYILFNESYVDADNNPATAAHGGTDGVLFQTLEGASLPGNRTDATLTISQADIYSLYQSATFDYGNGNGEVSVFNNPAKPDRTSTDRFIDGDSFSIRWEMVTADGRVFNNWSPSVCTEVPGANCQVGWQVICVSDLGGTYSMTSTGNDYYGNPFSYTFDQTFATTDADGAALPDGKYLIGDLSGGMEPNIWDNPPVEATVVDACGKIVLDLSTFSYIYGYSINSGSVDPGTGVITIVWQNIYGENGVNVYTPK